MAEVNPSCFKLSASSIASYKACPKRWQLAYREGLRLDQDTDSLRVGTNWHALHEVYANALSAWTVTDGPVEGYGLNLVVEHLNERYKDMPSYKTPQEWALERQILITSFMGYLWYWQNDRVEFLHSELPFDLPLHDPVIGLPLPLSEVMRVGKIDHIIKWNGAVCALERKSTSRGIGPDSDYWEKSQKDTQVSMYALAFRDMAKGNVLPESIWHAIGVLPTEVMQASWPRFGNTLYDVWHKPTIKPAMLTQKDTAALIETGKYCEQDFKVESMRLVEDDATHVYVDGEDAEIELGKKGFAIRETVGMFAARLLQDIYERPDFYFARREIARTDEELRKFRVELYNIYQTMKTMARTGHFYENESQCRATFACAYIPICYGAGADAVLDGTTTPQGFKRIFVDLKVNGLAMEE